MSTPKNPPRKNRNYYTKLFKAYPDLVSLKQFRQMLGGISDQAARKLMHENRVQHFYIQTAFHIPKKSVIDYVLSDDYKEYRNKLKVQI